MTQLCYKRDHRFDHPVAIDPSLTELILDAFRVLVQRCRSGVRFVAINTLAFTIAIGRVAADFVLCLLILPFTDPD